MKYDQVGRFPTRDRHRAVREEWGVISLKISKEKRHERSINGCCGSKSSLSESRQRLLVEDMGAISGVPIRRQGSKRSRRHEEQATRRNTFSNE